jgi:hypothetical protein
MAEERAGSFMIDDDRTAAMAEHSSSMRLNERPLYVESRPMCRTGLTDRSGSRVIQSANQQPYVQSAIIVSTHAGFRALVFA